MGSLQRILQAIQIADVVGKQQDHPGAHYLSLVRRCRYPARECII
jgi:hypothetical protein